MREDNKLLWTVVVVKQFTEDNVWPCGPTDKASDYESGDCRFESCQGHKNFYTQPTFLFHVRLFADRHKLFPPCGKSAAYTTITKSAGCRYETCQAADKLVT